jgi:hypothetical protein
MEPEILPSCWLIVSANGVALPSMPMVPPHLPAKFAAAQNSGCHRRQ